MTLRGVKGQDCIGRCIDISTREEAIENAAKATGRHIYTDGSFYPRSKDVRAALWIADTKQPKTYKLQHLLDIYTAGLFAINAALDLINEETNTIEDTNIPSGTNNPSTNINNDADITMTNLLQSSPIRSP